MRLHGQQEKKQNLSSYLMNEPLSAKSSTSRHYFLAQNNKNKENAFIPVNRPNSIQINLIDQPQRSYSSCNDVPHNLRFPLRSGSQTKIQDKNTPTIKQPLYLKQSKQLVYYKKQPILNNSSYLTKNIQKAENLQKYRLLQEQISTLEDKIRSMKFSINTSNLHYINQQKKKFNNSSTERLMDYSNQSGCLQNKNKKILTEISESIGDFKQIKETFNDNLQKTQQQLQKFVTQENLKTNKQIIPNKTVVNVKQIAMKAFDQVLESQTQQNQKTQQTQFLYYISSVIKAFISQESNKQNDLTRDHMFQTFQEVRQMPYLIQPNQTIIDERKCILKKQEQYKYKKTIIFDLDETLIHCNQTPNTVGDVQLPIRLPNGELIYASVNVRPYAIQILETLSKYFEIIIFTASHGCYANVVIDYLDPHKRFVSHRLFRESCIPTQEGNYIKDLRVISNRDLKDILIVDNATYTFGFQLGNGVPIIPFYDDKSDQELIYLQNYLLTFIDFRDVREKNINDLKLNRLVEFNDHLEFLQTLFLDQIPKQWL